MEVCASCGHRLGVGRFCTNCGHRVDEPAPPLLPATLAGASRPPPRPPQRWLPWLVGGAALLLVAMTGALLLVGGDDEPGSGSDRATDRASDRSAVRSASPDADRGGSRPPRRDRTPPPGRAPLELAPFAAVVVPETAPPNQDVSGDPVAYVAENMIDADPETCWRMPGSGAGGEVVLTFDEPVELTEVGLVNGYAKTSGSFDWYAGNRRLLEVEWVFDDGTTAAQTLDTTRRLQVLRLDPVTTSTVTLRLVAVSEPGEGRSARDYTAISDVSLVGRPR